MKFNFLENYFFQQLSQYSTSSRIFAFFEETVEASERHFPACGRSFPCGL